MIDGHDAGSMLGDILFSQNVQRRVQMREAGFGIPAKIPAAQENDIQRDTREQTGRV